MRKRARSAKTHQLSDPTRASMGTPPRPIISRTAAMQALGEVVYAVRVGNTIKIGHTADLGSRFTHLKADEMLAFRAGTYADEQDIHADLVEHLARGREWYHATPEVLAVVNAMRDELALPPVAA